MSVALTSHPFAPYCSCPLLPAPTTPCTAYTSNLIIRIILQACDKIINTP